jgi:hypothetical protein
MDTFYENGMVHATFPPIFVRTPWPGKDFQGNDFQKHQDLLQESLIKNSKAMREEPDEF